MAEPEKPKNRGLTRVASRASLTIFFVAFGLLAVGGLLRSAEIFWVALASILAVPGLLLGAVALLGFGRARIRDIFVALVGISTNTVVALLFCSKIDTPHRRCTSAKSVCLANLKQIEAAKAIWALEYHKDTNDIPSNSDLFRTNLYLHFRPVCVAGGAYRIGKVGELTRCWIPGHTL